MANFPYACAQCGAPLPTPPANATAVVCQHCHTTTYANAPAAAAGPRTLSAADMAFLQELVQANKRTEAIEMYCRLTGASLSAAYEAINNLQNPATPPGVPWDEIRALVQSQRKIEAIKRIRETTQLGLKESKDIADALERGEAPPADLRLRAELPPATADAPLARVYTLMQAGQKIEAIKAYREATGASLVEAKDAVEAVMNRGASELPAFVKRAAPAAGQSGLDQVKQLLRSGQKIEAIKAYREMTAVGLKEAKDAVEALERGEPIPQGALVPTPSARPRGGSGCWSVALWFMVLCLGISGGCGLYVQQTPLYQCAATHLQSNGDLQETLGRPVQLVGPAFIQNYESEGNQEQFTVFTGIRGPNANGLIQISSRGRAGAGTAFVYATLYLDFKALDIELENGPFVECP